MTCTYLVIRLLLHTLYYDYKTKAPSHSEDSAFWPPKGDQSFNFPINACISHQTPAHVTLQHFSAKGFVHADAGVMWYIYTSESSIPALVLHIHPQDGDLFFFFFSAAKMLLNTQCGFSPFLFVRVGVCLRVACLSVCVSTRSLTAPANAQIVHSGAACNVKDDNISERIYTIKEGDTLVLQCIVKGHPRPQVSSRTTCWRTVLLFLLNVTWQ